MEAKEFRHRIREAAHEDHLDAASVEAALVRTQNNAVPLRLEEALKRRLVDQSRRIVKGMEEVVARHESKRMIDYQEKQGKLPFDKHLVDGWPVKQAVVALA